MCLVVSRQILVIGYSDDNCGQLPLSVAYQTGRLIAQRGAVLVTGGMGGVMREASHGAHDAGGIVLGITPHRDSSMANEYCSVVVPTGIGLMRDFVNVHSADGVIIVGGGVGTLSEMCAAYMYNKPMVAVRGTGGMADRFAGQYLDHCKKQIVQSVSSPQDAVDAVFTLS